MTLKLNRVDFRWSKTYEKVMGSGRKVTLTVEVGVDPLLPPFLQTFSKKKVEIPVRVTNVTPSGDDDDVLIVSVRVFVPLVLGGSMTLKVTEENYSLLFAPDDLSSVYSRFLTENPHEFDVEGMKITLEFSSYRQVKGHYEYSVSVYPLSFVYLPSILEEVFKEIVRLVDEATNLLLATTVDVLKVVRDVRGNWAVVPFDEFPEVTTKLNFTLTRGINSFLEDTTVEVPCYEFSFPVYKKDWERVMSGETMKFMVITNPEATGKLLKFFPISFVLERCKFVTIIPEEVQPHLQTLNSDL